MVLCMLKGTGNSSRAATGHYLNKYMSQRNVHNSFFSYKVTIKWFIGPYGRKMSTKRKLCYILLLLYPKGFSSKATKNKQKNYQINPHRNARNFKACNEKPVYAMRSSLLIV